MPHILHISLIMKPRPKCRPIDGRLNTQNRLTTIRGSQAKDIDRFKEPFKVFDMVRDHILRTVQASDGWDRSQPKLTRNMMIDV
jgi:hypothetical protein